MSILDFFRDKPVELKLSTGSQTFDASKVGMPKPQPIDVSLESLNRYARKSEIVFACIEKKATAACDPVLVVEKRVGEEWQPVQAHPLVNLLNKPNEWDDGESFIKTWIASENFADNFYCEIVRSRAGVPVALYPLNPIYIVPQYFMGGNGWYIGFYYYFGNNGYPVRLEVDDLLIRRRHGLGSIYSDVSNVAVASAAVDADTSATEYIRAFWNNGGAPSGVLAIAGRNMTQEEVAHIQQQWTSKYGRNGTNRGGPAVLPEGTTYVPVSAKLNELNNESLNDETTTKICMAFGVPPIIIGALVGLKHVTQNATFKSAMGEFWMHTMSPELKSIRNFLTWNLLPMFEPLEQIKAGNIRVNWDMAQVMALQEDIDGVHSRVGQGYQNGIYMLNEARAKVGLDAVDPKIGDQFYKPPAPVHMGQDPNATPPPKQLTAGKDSAVEMLQKWLDEPVTDEGEADYQQIKEALRESLYKFSPDVLDADTLEKKTLETGYRRELTPVEQSIDVKAIEQAYESGKEALTATILAIRCELYKQGAREGAKLKDSALHTLTLTAPSGAYKRIEKDIKLSISYGQSQIVGQTIKVGKAITNDNIEFKGIIDDLLKRLVELTLSRMINEVSSAIVNIITALGVLGYNRDDIEQEIERRLDERSDAPYEAYARQATNSAVNAGRREEMQARADDISHFTWSSILDKAVCDPCAELDGAEANSLDQLPDAPYENCDGLANCRCFIICTFVGEGEPV